MQFFLSKLKKNITLITLIFLSILLFNQTVSAQWTMRGADEETPVFMPTIILNVGQTFIGNITNPIGHIVNPTIQIISSNPTSNLNVSFSSPALWNSGVVIPFAITAPSSVLSETFYMVKVYGLTLNSSYVSTTIRVKVLYNPILNFKPGDNIQPGPSIY